MGKRYHCDYCERSFADGAENRKKHLASIQHQKLRHAHYDMFKSASAHLEEHKLKKPCRKFHQSGHCDFGSSCKYSHLTPKDIVELEQQERQEKYGVAELPKVEPDIEEWLKTKISKIKKVTSSDTSLLHTALPPVLLNIPNLPPSLAPCKPSELLTNDKVAEQQWG